jgi:mRNA interferase RelE/StbE
MQILFEESFERDLKKIKDKLVRRKLKQIIKEIRVVENKNQIRNLKKLKDRKLYYRIRIGEYRIGIEIIKDKFIFTRILHRKDIYKYFP